MNPTMKKVNERLKNPPERRILNAFTVKDISTVVKDNYIHGRSRQRLNL